MIHLYEEENKALFLDCGCCKFYMGCFGFVFVFRFKMKKLGLILLGAPASGKGTQSRLICDKYDLVHVSTGEIFRTEMNKDPEFNRLAKPFIDHGSLIPDNITIAFLEDFLKDHREDSFLFDGFPRTQRQVKWLLNYFKINGYLIKVISMDVDEKELEKRLVERISRERRSDDSLKTFSIRRKVFHKHRDVVFNLLKEYVEIVDGNGSVSQVFSRIEEKLDQVLS